jgi:hypothetical protein
MPARARNRISIAALAALALALGLAASAVAVTVYSNDFSNRSEFEQIRPSGGGKRCDRRYREKQNTMLVSVKKGEATCGYRVPVQGDSNLPDHQLTVDTKILKNTPKSVRGGAFIELTLRAGGGGVGYSFRVFPQKGRFQLRRGPSGGGGDFPAEGKSKAIKGVNKRNKVTLIAKGARITAEVNRKQVASVQDSDPGEVTGRKVRFGIGNAKHSGKDVLAVAKAVAVGVPTK